jgi:hypothetical protein
LVKESSRRACSAIPRAMNDEHAQVARTVEMKRAAV